MEFNIKSRKETFRIKKISPTKLLALRMATDLNDIDSADHFYSFILENIEVKIKESWSSVKEGENYFPFDLEEDLNALEELTDYFTKQYLRKVFTKSNESTSNTEQNSLETKSI